MAGAFIGIDVGTGSARAGVFDAAGSMLGSAAHDIEIWKDAGDIVEQSSDDIWAAVTASVRQAVAIAELQPEDVAGIGFDATCSLVVVDAEGAPMPVGPSGDSARNLIVWMDHRAVDQAARINAAGHEVLRYVGGRISPEMQTPKLLWLKENLPATYTGAGHFFDLADFLSWRATGNTARSMCTVVCKWTYLGHERRWDESYFRQIGLHELADEGFARIGTGILEIGAPVGAGLTPDAAAAFGLLPGTPVGASLIDAHAGGVGTLGGRLPSGARSDPLAQVAVILGTSSCTMSITRKPAFVPGVWGPYHGAMLPGCWLNEGGQSAFGAALDQIAMMHPASGLAREKAAALGLPVPALLEMIACEAAGSVENAVRRAARYHVVPEFLGNRAPEADPGATAVIAGLRLESGLDSLADLHVAALCGLSYGMAQILDAQRAQGVHQDMLVLSGGIAKSPLMRRVLADATLHSIALPRCDEPVLLGAAMLGAVAAGRFDNLQAAAGEMSVFEEVLTPGGGDLADLHLSKRQVFDRLQACEREIRAMMG